MVEQPEGREDYLSGAERLIYGALALVLILWFLRIGLRPVTDPDAWLHLRIGTFLNDGGRFDSLPDPWTPYAERVYLPTQWLAERLGAWVFGVAGLPGVAVLTTLTSLALLLALIAACRQVADRLPATIAGLMAFIATAGSHTERPQLAAIVMIAVSVGAWWRTIRDGRPRWWLVPWAWLLANVHGLWLVNVIIGVVFCAVALWDARSRWRERVRLMWIPTLSAVAAAVTPLGPPLLTSPIQVTGTVREYVMEWQPVGSTHPVFLLTAAMLMLVTIIWTWGHTSPPPSRSIILLASSVCIAWSGRTIAIGAILGAGLLAESLQALRRRPAARQLHSFEWWFWGATTAILIAATLILAPRMAREPTNIAEGLAEQLRALPDEALLLPDHGLSGWVMWEAPKTQLVFDLRTEIYALSHIEGYVTAVSLGPGWEGFVRDSGATHALFPTKAPISEALERDGWNTVAANAEYTLLKAPSARLP